MATIDMTREELKDFIEEVVEEKYGVLHPLPAYGKDPRSLSEVIESLKRNIWTPPPGSPSTLELLREDRDR